MVEENMVQGFRLKKVEETRNYFIKNIDQNEMMSKKHKKACTTLNYIENFPILAFADTGCIQFLLLLLCLLFL